MADSFTSFATTAFKYYVIRAFDPLEELLGDDGSPPLLEERIAERLGAVISPEPKQPFIGPLTEDGDGCSLMPPEISRETTGPWVNA